MGALLPARAGRARSSGGWNLGEMNEGGLQRCRPLCDSEAAGGARSFLAHPAAEIATRQERAGTPRTWTPPGSRAGARSLRPPPEPCTLA